MATPNDDLVAAILTDMRDSQTKILMTHWHLITESNRLGTIYSEPLIVAYRKDKSLKKDLLVRPKIPSHI